jgi:hypothetical protein
MIGMIFRNFYALSVAAAAALAVVAAGSAGVRSAQAVGDTIVLAPHRAVYDLKLAETRGKQPLQAARGRILYDFSGSPCEGYSLSFRQVTELDSGEGKSAVSDLRTTNWEEGAGESFRFISSNLLNNEPVNAAEGRAARNGNEVTVTLTKPEAKTLQAGDVVFPSEHMRQIILAARAGKSLLEIGVYDGSDVGEKIYNSLTVIGQPIGPSGRQPSDAAAGQPALASLTRWPLTVSYFDRAKGEGDQTPLYSISFEAYENGIARGLKLDYGTFVLTGEMTTLEMRASKPCP